MAAPTVTLNVRAALDGQATVASADSPASGTGGNTRRFNEYNVEQLLKGTTTPKVNQWPADLQHTLSGTSTVFDLTAIRDARDVNDTLDLTNDRVVAMLLKMGSGNNAAGVTVDADPSNGYNIFGASGQVILYPGQLGLFAFTDANSLLPVITASIKRIRFQGAISDTWNGILYTYTP